MRTKPVNGKCFGSLRHKEVIRLDPLKLLPMKVKTPYGPLRPESCIAGPLNMFDQYVQVKLIKFPRKNSRTVTSLKIPFKYLT